MKKKYLVLFILSLFLISCRSPQQRPNNQGQMAGRLETNKSSIFRTAPVEYCRITSESADVKDGLGLNFNTIATLNRDEVVKVLDEVDDRYVVQLANNQIGSIDTNSAEPIVREEASPKEQVDRSPQPQPDTPNAVITPPAGGNIPDTFIQPETLKPEGQPGLFRPGLTEGQRSPEIRTPQEKGPQQQARSANPTTPTTEGPTGDLQSQAVQMVDLVNQERTKNGLPTLAIDNEVARVAGVKSQDMVDNNYFSHYSPTYGSPFEMLDSFGVHYLQAGENLAGNSSVSAAHTALMNSSSHRQNILHPNFTHIGIGVRSSPRYGYIYTQMFISK